MNNRVKATEVFDARKHPWFQTSLPGSKTVVKTPWTYFIYCGPDVQEATDPMLGTCFLIVPKTHTFLDICGFESKSQAEKHRAVYLESLNEKSQELIFLARKHERLIKASAPYTANDRTFREAPKAHQFILQQEALSDKLQGRTLRFGVNVDDHLYWREHYSCYRLEALTLE